jgi:hypothetical protein
MVAHVTTTHFLPGVEVGLYPRRPQSVAATEAVQVKTVPDGGQLTFEVDAPAVRYWLAAIDPEGRLRIVQVHSKPGDPVDVRAILSETRPIEPDGYHVRGARGTQNAHRRFLRRRK